METFGDGVRVAQNSTAERAAQVLRQLCQLHCHLWHAIQHSTTRGQYQCSAAVVNRARSLRTVRASDAIASRAKLFI